jgi:hypothetical protein
MFLNPWVRMNTFLEFIHVPKPVGTDEYLFLEFIHVPNPVGTDEYFLEFIHVSKPVGTDEYIFGINTCSYTRRYG